MKLKKIASLMLAGVMAVSMLAGCSGKGTTTEDGSTVNTSTSSIVNALNNAQSADNDAKVTFSADSTLDAALQKAIAMLGEGANVDNVRKNIGLLTGKYGTVAANGSFTPTGENDLDKEDGSKVSVLIVKEYKDAYWTESSVVEAAGRYADELIADLMASTKDGTAQGEKYWDYTYTGTASMATLKKTDGTTSYFVEATVTRTATEGTVPTV